MPNPPPLNEDFADMLEALSSAGISQADFEQLGNVYQIGLPPRRIDILTEISGVTFDEAWASRVEAQLGGHTIAILGRAALIRNKRATGRDKDLLDAEWLEKSM